MTERQTFVLVNDRVRNNAVAAIRGAPDGYIVKVAPPTRSLDQNAKFHAICQDLARSQMRWAGARRTLDEWKALLISGHAVATQHGGEVIPGIENEFVAIRESSASMSVSRAASLIEYALAFCHMHQVPLTETTRSGFIDA
jgi:hypothetical protein